MDKFSVLAASGQMTDMFYIAAENKQEVISKGVAEDISDMEIFSRIDPATSATYGKDGKIYGYSPDAVGLEESSITKIYLNRPGIEKSRRHGRNLWTARQNLRQLEWNRIWMMPIMSIIWLRIYTSAA